MGLSQNQGNEECKKNELEIKLESVEREAKKLEILHESEAYY